MKVYNKYHNNAPDGAVYIGKPSYWGNPFIVTKKFDRSDVLARYSDWLNEKIKDKNFQTRLKELAKAPGLICFCSPKPCHGDLLILAMKRLGFLPLEEGDFVQWLSGGQYQFSRPKKISSIINDPDHGVFAFVEGSNTGVPVDQLVVSQENQKHS